MVVEPYAKAIETAWRTVRLAQELGIARTSLLASKVRDDTELALLDSLHAELKVELIGGCRTASDSAGGPVRHAADRSRTRLRDGAGGLRAGHDTRTPAAGGRVKVAFVGKGGTGKSALAGTLCHHLARRGERVLALDLETVARSAAGKG